jgi:hypothetical protein
MNRLNQTEPATFSILSCWAVFRDSVFSISVPEHTRTLNKIFKKKHGRGLFAAAEDLFISKVFGDIFA